MKVKIVEVFEMICIDIFKRLDGTIKKSFNIITAGFRVLWWGSVAYFAYTFYDYKTNPNKKASNRKLSHIHSIDFYH